MFKEFLELACELGVKEVVFKASVIPPLLAESVEDFTNSNPSTTTSELDVGVVGDYKGVRIRV